MGRVSGQQQRYLENHRGLWRVVVAVPKALAPTLGPRLKRSLGTGSLREANAKKWAVVAEFKSLITAQGKGPGLNARLTEEAEAWQKAVAASSGGPYDPVEGALSDRLDTIEREHGKAKAVEFAKRAQGLATPLDAHLEAFMASRGTLKADTRRRHGAAIKALSKWLKANDLPQTLQAITRQVAIRYVDQLPPGRPDPDRLSLQWAWMVQREMVAADHWT
ncbi:MAG TPA: DUF6538 domain-containing protein, partial [Roseiarcus sp.]